MTTGVSSACLTAFGYGKVVEMEAHKATLIRSLMAVRIALLKTDSPDHDI
jgi:hypothetical protein